MDGIRASRHPASNAFLPPHQFFPFPIALLFLSNDNCQPILLNHHSSSSVDCYFSSRHHHCRVFPLAPSSVWGVLIVVVIFDGGKDGGSTTITDPLRHRILQRTGNGGDLSGEWWWKEEQRRWIVESKQHRTGVNSRTFPPWCDGR